MAETIPFPDDVVVAMNKLLVSGSANDPHASFVEAAVLAVAARVRAEAEADEVIYSTTSADPLNDMFVAGFKTGAAEATRALSKVCADDSFARAKVRGNG